jgi:hypothetical protein
VSAVIVFPVVATASACNVSLLTGYMFVLVQAHPRRGQSHTRSVRGRRTQRPFLLFYSSMNMSDMRQATGISTLVSWTSGRAAIAA